MDEELVCPRLARVELSHDVVNVRDSRRDEKGKDEGDDVMLVGPNVDVDRVEDGEEREAPRDAIDDDALAAGEELVYDSAEKQEMDKRPARGECELWDERSKEI